MKTARIGRRRHLRKSSFGRLRRNGPVQFRSSYFVEFLEREGVRLNPTAAVLAFTAANATDILTTTPVHSLADAQGPLTVANAGGALPDGLVDGVLYWPNVIDADEVTLYWGERSSLGNIVNFIDDGTGTQSMVRATAPDAMFEVNKVNKPETIAAAADIDALP